MTCMTLWHFLTCFIVGWGVMLGMFSQCIPCSPAILAKELMGRFFGIKISSQFFDRTSNVAKLSWANSDKIRWAGLLCFDHSLGNKQDGNSSWLFNYSHDLSIFEYTYLDNIGVTTKCVFESAWLCVSMSRASCVANAPFPSPNENKHKNRWQWGYTTTPARSVPSRRCQKLTWTWACTDVSKRCFFHGLGQSWKRWKVICMHELSISMYVYVCMEALSKPKIVWIPALHSVFVTNDQHLIIAMPQHVAAKRNETSERGNMLSDFSKRLQLVQQDQDCLLQSIGPYSKAWWIASSALVMTQNAWVLCTSSDL